MEDAVIAVTFFTGIFATLVILIVFRSKTKREQQETIRTAIEKGQEMTPELIAQIGSPPPPARDRDLRRAAIAFAIGGGFIGLGFGVADADATRAMTGVASFPILIGVAFLVMHFFGSKES